MYLFALWSVYCLSLAMLKVAFRISSRWLFRAGAGDVQFRLNSISMNALKEGKHLLIGITGGIAAYKIAELVRLAIKAGFDVRVMMTSSACEFIAPLTLQALSGNPVHTALLDPGAEQIMGHIDLARWADQILIAPASANCIAKLAHGLADSLLTTVCLATSAPIKIAPAMNRLMWLAPQTQNNIATLKSLGMQIIGPAEGDQACGEVGPGRMVEADDLLSDLLDQPVDGPLTGKKVLLTAGPTREAIDPVRYITNRSSGRMGYALANVARAAGAEVTLVSGPVHLPPPSGVVTHRVESAGEMFAAVMSNIADQDIFIASAAVADYRMAQVVDKKMKKSNDELTLTLTANADILAEVAGLPDGPFTVGFAAETNDVEYYARQKLENKRLDMIAANQVGKGLGFDTEDNALHVFWQGGDQKLPRTSKDELAVSLINLIIERYSE